MLSKKEVLNYAKLQLAKDYNCQLEDLNKTTNTLSKNLSIDGRRIYEGEDALLKILCFGSCAVFTASEILHPYLQENFLKRNSSWLFDFQNLRAIDKYLSGLGHEIGELSVFYLPNPDQEAYAPPFKVKWFEKDDIEQFREDNRFQEAYIFDPECPDVLGIGAYDEEGQIMGMAGATSDTDKLYQIGIDVIEGYRHRGIGAALVRLLKNELLSRGIVPFYKTSVSHMTSRNVAINAGFFPGWTEIYTRSIKE
jgi:GNAT superfamily N-acetyltransferase